MLCVYASLILIPMLGHVALFFYKATSRLEFAVLCILWVLEIGFPGSGKSKACSTWKAGLQLLAVRAEQW